MSTVKRFEDAVLHVEGFAIRIRHSRDGRDVRSDYETTATYPYRHRARSEWTVKDFLDKRLAKRLPGFNVEVVNPAGRRVNGSTKLRNLRAEFLT